eukprot:scaffold105683_cov27-Tisochrysis_lutea.AAC.1
MRVFKLIPEAEKKIRDQRKKLLIFSHRSSEEHRGGGLSCQVQVGLIPPTWRKPPKKIKPEVAASRAGVSAMECREARGSH